MKIHLCELYLLVAIVMICLLLFRRRFNKHSYNQKLSKRILHKINSFPYEGQKINYLRKIDPFVFEELLLDAFAHKGFTIRRNRRYTNDGGIDGILYKDNVKYLIQAKRYKGYVNKAHLVSFIELTEKNKCKGFFCHTGKTGTEGKTMYRNHANVEIYSGSKLLELINTLEKL